MVTTSAAPPVVDVASVLAALEDVPDPEIPAVSIVELGMVGGVEVDDAGIRVELLPTFVGCPALEVIRDAVGARLGAFDRPVRVDVSFATPWSSERISPSGREKLRRSGFAPPPLAPLPAAWAGRTLPILDAASALGDSVLEPVPCPFCGSLRTTLENVFGPTQCRSIRHCADCRQPFEAFKPV